MREVESSSAKGEWKLDASASPFLAPSHLDINCGVCARSQVGVSLQWQKIGSSSLFVELRCVGCGSLSRILMLEPPQTQPRADAIPKRIKFYQHPSGTATKFDEKIEKLSPKYVEVYLQAEQAEQLGLGELVGCGYRRALEFLVKDFLVNHKFRDDSEEQEKIKNPSFPLSKAVEKLDAPGIIESARAASWLGNDKTHYTEKHNAIVEELKRFIDIVVAHMKYQLLMEKMKNN